AASRVVYLIGKRQRNVEPLLEARKMEPRAFVAGVELVEQQKEPEQTFVSVLRSKVHAMVVIPQGAERFINVAVGLVGRVKSSQHVGILLIVEVPDLEEIAREAV